MSTDLFGVPLVIPALSLWEGWASLIAAGFKRHETRHWPTKKRGLIAIHAAKRVDVDGSPAELCEFAFGADWAWLRPVGCVIAVAQLTDCISTNLILPGELHHCDEISGNYAPDRWAFRLAPA